LLDCFKKVGLVEVGCGVHGEVWWSEVWHVRYGGVRCGGVAPLKRKAHLHYKPSKHKAEIPKIAITLAKTKSIHGRVSLLFPFSSLFF
jgi:hypothetical protein